VIVPEEVNLALVPAVADGNTIALAQHPLAPSWLKVLNEPPTRVLPVQSGMTTLALAGVHG
jgi:hypothetical protein